jgi:ankyrin repeat/BTB/POZ domain-containing protein 1
VFRSIRYYLSERFRLRFEDSGLEDMLDEDGEINVGAVHAIADSATAAASANDEAIDVEMPKTGNSDSENANGDHSNIPHGKEPEESVNSSMLPAGFKTLDGEIAGDEFAADAINYQVLLRKIDTLLDRLKLDA